MPRHIIEVHTFIHTCPADPLVHVVETWRALIETITTACTTPQRIQSGSTVAYVDCGSILVPARRCAACTVIVDVRDAFTTHLGHEHPCTTSPTTGGGVLPDPCPRCRLPVSTLYADVGRHPACDPAWTLAGAA